MAVLPVHGHEVARPDQVQHELQLLLRRVPGDVHGAQCGRSGRSRRVGRGGSPGSRSRARCPGMMREESTTVSPGSRCTCLCAFIAMRTSADAASAWLPAVMSATRSRGRSRGHAEVDERALGHVEEPEVARHADVRRRGSGRRARPCARSAPRSRSTCCMRWMCEEKVVTSDAAACACGRSPRAALPTLRSDGGHARRARRSSSRRAGAARPRRRARRGGARSGSRPSSGVWSSLKSPVWTTVPTGVRMASPTESGIECVIANGSTCERPDPARLGPVSRERRACSPCSRSRSRTKPSVSGVPVDRARGTRAST